MTTQEMSLPPCGSNKIRDVSKTDVLNLYSSVHAHVTPRTFREVRGESATRGGPGSTQAHESQINLIQ